MSTPEVTAPAMQTRQWRHADVADPMRPAPYRVVASEPASRDSVTLVLEPVAQPLAPAAPGQFTMMWAWGFGEVPISISGLLENGRLAQTIREVGPVTRALCRAKPGETLGLRGPFGVGWPLDSARGHDVVVVGGGIGLAPMRPVVHALLAERAEFGAVTLVVGARTVHDLLFRTELDAWWRQRSIRVRTIVDEPCSHWSNGAVGIVTHELARVQIDGPETFAMLCGPEVMIRFVGDELVDRGVPPDHIAVSLERNMQCGVGLCGHCQIAGRFVCMDGPVFSWEDARPLLEVHEL